MASVPPARPSALEAVARRDRRVVLAGLLGVSALAWGYTAALAGPAAGGGALHAKLHPWTAADLALTSLMWIVMMVAMMAPTAAPMLLTLARLERQRPRSPQPLSAASAFLLGYLLVWTAASLLFTLAQWGLHHLALISAEGASESVAFAGLLLLAAGAYQLTPLKDACLTRCRSPLLFLLSSWRPGAGGALHMGVRHGAICAGCCGALMALMFVAGTMNLLWAAALMVLMFAEKALPAGRTLAHAAGLGLVGAGLALLGAELLGFS